VSRGGRGGRGRGRGPYKRADHFTRKARAQGFAARSVFKLEEIQRRARPLAPGQAVVDLGCAPGSWSRYVRQVIGADAPLVGVDLQPTQGIRGTFLEASVYDVTPGELLSSLGRPADAVVSDMAPRTTGDRFGDHVRQVALARRALEIARASLRPGGNFVVKVFDGAEAQDFAAEVRASFGRVRRLKPAATRGQSVEFFLVGLGHRSEPDDTP